VSSAAVIVAPPQTLFRALRREFYECEILPEVRALTPRSLRVATA
jgi:hypothetical protein